MSYKITEINEIDVIGSGWYNQRMCYTYKLTNYDIENIGKLTRNNVENWLCTNSGDFQSIDEFRIDIKHFISDFKKEENHFEFMDIMFPIHD